MTREPQVSVVMGVFNSGSYVARSVESILGQTYSDFELVVVNDGSTDNTLQILEEIAKSDNRVRIITQSHAGLTRALIRGCASVRGQYIARQDDDDLSMPDRLRLQSNLLDADPGLAFVSCWSEVIGPANEPLFTKRWPIDPSQATHQLCETRVGPIHGSVMFRRDAYERVGGYRAILYYAQDADLWLRMAVAGKIGYVPRVLYQFRVSPESISGNLHADKVPYARLIDELYEARRRGEDEAPILARATLSRPGTGQGTRSSADATLYFIGRCLFARRDPRARVYLRDCLRRNPRHLRAWVLCAATEVVAPFWSIPGSSSA